ncbi:MAG: iron ABC transporter permease [Bacteroidales bacterium]|nr:iron ABC transporter permease [Bacteroidales bacterium]
MVNNKIKWILITAALFLVLILVSLLSLTSGEFEISLGQLLPFLLDPSSMEYSVLMNIRLPRILLGIAVGGILSMAGVVLQGIYRNPLVEPYTLGISGGAALGVSLSIVFQLHIIIGAFMLSLSGFAGAFVAIFLVYFLSMKKGSLSVNKMLLIGVMISFIASSAMMFLLSVSTVEDVHSIVFWIMGSLEESNTMLIYALLIGAFAGLLLVSLFVRELNAIRIGEDQARHLGINTGVVIRILFVILSLLTGICVSVVGIIGFVGLIIPHVVRLFVGTDFRILLPCSFLGGGIFLIVCDIIARTIISPNELPIGVITGILGGIFFIIILHRSKTLEKS